MQTRGYLMVELLLVLMISLTMLILYMPKLNETKYDDYIFGNDYLYIQSEAMAKDEHIEIINDYDLMIKYPIHFNNEGNVNQAQTIHGINHNIIIHLGNGYITYE